MYYSFYGSYYDNPWGPSEIYIYGIRADGNWDLLISVRPNSKDWGYGGNLAMSGTIAYTNIRVYRSGGGPKTTAHFT